MEKDLSADFKTDTRARLDRIEGKVDKLIEFKWRVIGGAGAIGGIVTVVLSLVVEWVRR